MKSFGLVGVRNTLEIIDILKSPEHKEKIFDIESLDLKTIIKRIKGKLKWSQIFI